MTESNYDAESIQVLSHREAVRLRPGMYIGGSDRAAMHHLVSEIVDNAIDEAINGHASHIEVTLGEDLKTISVQDNGRGIPVATGKTGRPAVELVFTKLHAGAKFDQEGGSYKSSGGLHGVGAAVTNFLSETLDVTVWRGGSEYEISFKNGFLEKELEVVGDCGKRKSGTKVTFKPDSAIFSTHDFDPELIADRLEVKTYLNPGLKIKYTSPLGEYVYQHDDGVSEYLQKILLEHKSVSLLGDPIRIVGEDEKSSYEVVLTWTEETSEATVSFINAIPTTDGGTHENGFRDGMVKALRSYMATSSELPKRLSIKTDDIREGMFAVINVFSSYDLQFQSQNKTRLTTPELQSYLASEVKLGLEQWLFANPDSADAIVKRIVASARAREASRSISKVSRKSKKNARKLTLPGKLSDCSSNAAVRCELFLVEGDSAGGNAKVARDRETQAILPLRGKVLNTETAQPSSVLKNKELSGIVEALGCGIGQGLNLNDLRYHKIILLMDADSDGHHISTLLLTFFYRYMPELIEKGHIYIAMPPLYKIMHGKDRYWIQDDQEKEMMIQKLQKKDARKKLEISRFKGLGEMMADTLRETALDPRTRHIIQVKIPEGELRETEETFVKLMGKDSSSRQEMILTSLEEDLDLDI